MAARVFQRAVRVPVGVAEDLAGALVDRGAGGLPRLRRSWLRGWRGLRGRVSSWWAQSGSLKLSMMVPMKIARDFPELGHGVQGEEDAQEGDQPAVHRAGVSLRLGGVGSSCARLSYTRDGVEAFGAAGSGNGCPHFNREKVRDRAVIRNSPDPDVGAVGSESVETCGSGGDVMDRVLLFGAGASFGAGGNCTLCAAPLGGQLYPVLVRAYPKAWARTSGRCGQSFRRSGFRGWDGVPVAPLLPVRQRAQKCLVTTSRSSKFSQAKLAPTEPSSPA